MVAKKATARIERLIAENYQRGLTIRDIARTLELSTDTVRQSLIRAGVTRRKRGFSYSKYEDQIRDMYLGGDSTYVIANKLKLTPATVCRYLKRMRIPRRDRVEAIIMFHRGR